MIEIDRGFRGVLRAPLSIYDPITRFFFYLLAVNSEQITARGPILGKSMRALTVHEESVSGALSLDTLVMLHFRLTNGFFQQTESVTH